MVHEIASLVLHENGWNIVGILTIGEILLEVSEIDDNVALITDAKDCCVLCRRPIGHDDASLFAKESIVTFRTQRVCFLLTTLGVGNEDLVVQEHLDGKLAVGDIHMFCVRCV